MWRFSDISMQPFAEKLRILNGSGLKRRAVDVLQVNLGALLQSGLHSLPCRSGADAQGDDEPGECRRGAAFSRRAPAFRHSISPAARRSCIRTFDYLVESARGLGRQVMDRCNLNGDLRAGERLSAGVFSPAASRTGLFAALLFQRKCRQAARQRNFRRQHSGAADFQRTRLRPAGQRLGAQSGLQSRRTALAAAARETRAGLQADSSRCNSASSSIDLFCLTNMPITRYATHLKLRREYEPYMDLLETQFQRRHRRSSDVPQFDQRRLGRWDL